jgi:hypothetical protein
MALRHWRVTGKIEIEIDSLITDPANDNREACIALAIASAMQKGVVARVVHKVEEWDYAQALKYLDEKKRARS